jgi:hypothetical protein
LAILKEKVSQINPQDHYDYTKDYQTAISYYQANFYRMLNRFKEQQVKLLDHYTTDSARFLSRYHALMASLPTKTDHSSANFHKFELRKKRNPAIPLGILGTFMGLYSTYQIQALSTQLHDAIESHNRLVNVVQKQGDSILAINATISELINNIEIMAAMNPAYTMHELDRVERQISGQLDQAFNVLQSLQHRRLSMELLEAQHVSRLFSRLQSQSSSSGYRLLLEHHSDLFQLETSYFFDGSDVHLLVHVPMIPDDSLLRLFRLHAFPIPLSDQHMMIPTVDQDVLAISSGFERMSMQLSYVDLLGCHKVNQIFLCEQQGVLRNDLNSTCLGSLYNQDFSAASRLCKMTVHDSGEVVQQLRNNWYLSYSPVSLMAPVTCHNRTQSEIQVRSGITKFHIAPGCRAQFKQHRIISDLTLRSEAEILHYEWNWDNPISSKWYSSLTDVDIEHLQNHGISQPTITDLQHLKLHQTKTHNLTITSIIALTVFGLLLVCFAYGLARLYWLRRRLIASAPPSECKSTPLDTLMPPTPAVPAYHLVPQ